MWKPQEMPEIWQKKGFKVEIEAEKVVVVISIFICGTTMKILGFNTL